MLTGQGEYRRRCAFAEDATTRMAVDEKYKLVSYPDFDMLFDMQADPNELRNLALQRPEAVKEYKARIAEWLAATPPVLPPNPAPRQRRPSQA